VLDYGGALGLILVNQGVMRVGSLMIDSGLHCQTIFRGFALWLGVCKELLLFCLPLSPVDLARSSVFSL
jgi:hypothetical protein